MKRADKQARIAHYLDILGRMMKERRAGFTNRVAEDGRILATAEEISNSSWSIIISIETALKRLGVEPRRIR